VAAVFLLMVGAGAVALAQNWHGSRDWAVTRSTLLTERVRNWRSGRPPQPASGQETVTHPNAPSTSQAASSGVANENQEAASGGEQQEQTSGDSSTAEKNGSQQGAEAQANTGPAITVDNGKLDNGNNGNRASDKGQNPEYEAASKAPAEAKPKSETATPKAKAAIAETKPQPSVAAPTEGAAPTAAKQMAVARTTAPAEEDQRGDDLVARGERFLYGQGVRRDCNQAMVYFRAGAEQQNARALSRLGALYATGTCVPMDRVMAYNWFSRALAHDSKNPLLEDNLNMLWRDMSSSERNQVLEPKAHH
jgi:TPR repeat protein